ncbi:MAG: hypothetical protein R3Y07_00255 [Eubacteriales bacterium]
MSQITKKQILEILEDIKEGTHSLRDLKEESLSSVWMENIPVFGQLICMVGDHLLELSEEYAPLVELIEGYCLNLQKIETENLEIKERKKTAKEMLDLLQKLQFECKKRLPEDRKKLVFFPYLYAMWDSLESIWRAAVESGEYDVLVVPIPYYEKNPDGSFGKMNYDGQLYPDEVQVVDWKSYDVAAQKPDVAYVHNPYDDMNYVTSIHPNFYSKNLKEHVGSLVYVPYFVCVNDVITEDYCVNPVTISADYIIVQSEIVKEAYVDALYQFGKSNQLSWNKREISKRILPLGSPKYDSVKQDSEFDIPKEWESVLYKEDGIAKKVIFLNSTLSTVLALGEEALDKLEDNLATFEQKQDRIALLWRPHPLMESTLKSMRPQWYQRYLSIVKGYRNGNWGIFDDSKDFTRAVAVSDAYYGDHASSVVDVFEKAGKPIMMQNYKILYQSEYHEKEGVG